MCAGNNTHRREYVTERLKAQKQQEEHMPSSAAGIPRVWCKTTIVRTCQELALELNKLSLANFVDPHRLDRDVRRAAQHSPVDSAEGALSERDL